ncbi:MAG: hypothetical protein ACJ8G3_00745 [Burkholderiaceae bacterium]
MLEVEQRPAAAKLLGLATFGLAACAAGRHIAHMGSKARQQRHDLPDASGPARRLHAAAALLGLSVLADSAMEHWRGCYKNPGMFTPLLSALMAIGAGASGAGAPTARAQNRQMRDGAYAVAVTSGVAGTGFHLYNLLRRPGGLSWMNLFYAAPPGAPAALSLSGLLGMAAQHLDRQPASIQPRLLGLPAGRALAALASVGISGTAAEAALLHFRGAFQNPFMWLPVSVPPFAALLMARAAIGAQPPRPGLVRMLLNVTATLGIAGVCFHAYGVSRQMGGWRNARQNLLSGPPLPAPPAFLALALAGGAALSLLQAERAAKAEGK